MGMGHRQPKAHQTLAVTGEPSRSRLERCAKVEDLAWSRLFADFERAGASIHIQIRRTIIHAIEDGVLAPGARLPSSRRLGELLGVARNTVAAAYRKLSEDKFLVARDRSGIFVAERPTAPLRQVKVTPELEWVERFAVRPSQLRHISKPSNWLDYPYPFLFGQFDPALFPTNDWRESVKAASSVAEIRGWAGDRVDDDDPDLVEQLRLRVLPSRGVMASTDEIMVTIGAQQALSLLIRLLVGAATRAGVEDPCYPDIRNLLALRTGNLALLNVDEDGVVPDEVFAGCRVAFVSDAHQCPTTATMPLARRRALLAVAERHGVVVVEDDYEADIFPEQPADLPSLKSLDRGGRVIYVGSFSKALAPGLRLGYLVAPSAVVAELRVLRRLEMRHPPLNNQRAMATFLALGHYRSHLRRTGRVLAERAALIDRLLPVLLPQCQWRRDPGATSYWMQAPAGVEARALVAVARNRGVLVEPGDVFFAAPERGVRHFRLGFASIPTGRIEAGLERLHDVLRDDL